MIHRVLGEYWSIGFTVVVFAEWDFGPDDQLKSVETNKWVADAP
jgi:hypothetical protein